MAANYGRRGRSHVEVLSLWCDITEDIGSYGRISGVKNKLTMS